MNDREFKSLLGEYRGVLHESVMRPHGLGAATAGFDWLSDLYSLGTWKCAQAADAYLSKGSRVLDLGCGMGLMSVLMSRLEHEVTGIDIDIGNSGNYSGAPGSQGHPWGSRRAEIDNPGLIRDCWDTLGPLYDISFVPFDGRKIPFDDGSFDAVIMHAVFEHLPVEEIPAVLGEVHRVCAPGGFFFVFRTPREGSYIEGLSRRLGLAAHEKLYREEEVESLASTAGFHLARRNVTDVLPAFPPHGLSLYNKVAALAARLDRLLLATPLRRSAHHMALVFQRD